MAVDTLEMTETAVLPESPREVETRPEVARFKEEVSKADGTLIPLSKTTKDGQKLLIAVRHIKKGSPEADQLYSGWSDDHQPMTGAMLVDLYVQENAQAAPIGHMDWYFNGDYANGGGNMHKAVVPKNEHEQLAKVRGVKNYATAFAVDYQGQDLGSLMLAASAVALPALGIRKFYTGDLLLPAEKTYERFGVKREDFSGRGENRNLPIERLSQSPYKDQAISSFV